MGYLQNAVELITILILIAFKWACMFAIPFVLIYGAASLALSHSLPLWLGIALGLIVASFTSPLVKRIERYFIDEYSSLF